MKRYIKEMIISVLQLFMFYIFPMFAGPTDAMGMVVLILLATIVLSLFTGIFSREKFRFFYPVFAAVAFIPSNYIYYDGGALIHSVWYLVVSAGGLLIGTLIGLLIRKIIHR